MFLVEAVKGGMMSLMLVNLAAQLAVGILLRCGGRRTKAGAAQASELLGYRRWLLAAPRELLLANLESDPQYFYRVLPFADALRVGGALAGTLGRSELEPCDWLIWKGKPARTAPGFFARYERLMAGLRGERDPAPRQRPAREQQISTRVNLPRRPARDSRSFSDYDGRNGDDR